MLVCVMPSVRTLAMCVVISLLVSCAAPQIHVHDRHGLSYPPVRGFAKSHPGATLVLLDYHHDIGSGGIILTSSTWVGALLEERLLSRVIWVSGRNLLLPNRNARMKWLGRSLGGVPPSDAARIEERVTLADWEDLRAMRLKGPLIVSFDLDILSHDPGDPPERFLDELAAWIAKQRAPLLTVALSAAYQRSAASAWAWLERLVEAFPEKGAAWYLEAGPEAPFPEGKEEMGSWRLWNERPAEFERYGEGFWPGAGIWIGAPQGLRKALLSRNIQPGDEAATDIVQGWLDQDRAALERSFPENIFNGLAEDAAASLEAFWKGARLPEPPPGLGGSGVAVRILNNGFDRGCLALYGGVVDLPTGVRYCAQAAASDPRYPPVVPAERQDLEIELSVFGPWHEMRGANDFRPGLDSLLLVDGGRTTLLQASLAVERSYDRAAFLRVLSRKAGLGEEGWKKQGIHFKRSVTVWYMRPWTAIEGTALTSTTPRNR